MTTPETAKLDWENNTRFLEGVGLNIKLIGKTVKLNSGHWGKIGGLNARNRKYPFIVFYANNTKARKFTFEGFKELVKNISIA